MLQAVVKEEHEQLLTWCLYRSDTTANTALGRDAFVRGELVSYSASPVHLFTWKTNSSQENVYLIPLSNLADNFSCGWVDSWEGFLTDCIVPLVVYENLEGKQQSWVKT